MKRLLLSADDHGFGIFPPWIFGVDVVIKQGAKEMVDLMLQADGRITGCRDARMTVDEAFVFLQDGQAALALCEIGVLHAFGDDLRVGQGELIAAIFRRYADRDQLFGDPQLNGGDADGRTQPFSFGDLIVLGSWRAAVPHLPWRGEGDGFALGADARITVQNDHIVRDFHRILPFCFCVVIILYSILFLGSWKVFFTKYPCKRSGEYGRMFML